MSTITERPFKFADRVTVEGKIGTVIGANEEGIEVQFVRGKAKLKWSETNKVKHHKEVSRRGR